MTYDDQDPDGFVVLEHPSKTVAFYTDCDDAIDHAQRFLDAGGGVENCDIFTCDYAFKTMLKLRLNNYRINPVMVE